MPEINWDITPGWGGTAKIAKYAGRRKAKEWNLLGTLFSAQKAERYDLVNRLVEPEDLEREVERLIEILLSKDPVAMRCGSLRCRRVSHAPSTATLPVHGQGVQMTSQRPAKSRRTVAAVVIAGAVVAGLLLLLTNTSLGAYILLDYLADDDSGLVADPAAGPLELSEFVTAFEAAPAMPPQIDQPSGITYLEADRAFAIVTDQAELFVVSDDFNMVRSATLVLDGLLVTRQGVMEAVVSIDGERIALSGQTGRLDVWRKDAESEFSLETTIELSGYAGEGEVEGLAHNPRTGELYLTFEEKLAIAVVDRNGRVLRELTFEDDLRGQLKPGRPLSEYRLSGLDYADGLLYAVSEPYNTLFVIDPEQGLVRTLGIENGGPISAIAVRDGTAYLPLDHNYVDPRPPLLAVRVD